MQQWLYHIIRKYISPFWIRQDILKYLFLIPLIGISFFIFTVILILYTLQNIDKKNQEALLYRDLPWLNHKILTHAQNNEQHIKNIIQNVKPFFYDKAAFQELTQQFLKSHNEVIGVYKLNHKYQVDWSLPATSLDIDDMFNNYNDKPVSEIINAADESYKTQQIRYFTVRNSFKRNYIIMQIPLTQGSDWVGSISVIYSPEKLMNMFTSYDLIKNYHISLIDNSNNSVWFSTNKKANEFEANSHLVPFSILPNKLSLKGTRYLFQSNFFNNSLVWIIIILSFFIIWSLYLLWRYMYRNIENQRLLLAESAFRKSMGDSILVGMRAINMQGRISYVNPAFCRMTGFSEIELLETSSPFPYWPQSDYKELYHTFLNLLEGKTPDEGVEIRLQRKDGSIFYVRMHASPLMDGNGTQLGWLNSIIDVTDSKRAREELASAHRRFMTVVESLEVAVSVIMLENGDFLFYNRYYSQLFGSTNEAHLFLAKSPKTHKSQLTAIDWMQNIMPKLDYDYSYEEIHYPLNNKWFNIRTYPIQWVDGRIAQMMICLDITPIKTAQEQAKINEEKWHFANRVSNMGEMASSLAHELNQPLTAISNYCNGIIDRLKQENINLPHNILNALDKTSNQAVKAGGIIKRLRGFVSKSQPKKQFEDISNIAKEAIALIGFTIQQSNIKVKLDVQPNLPHILADRILIEQVLVNLLKNAIEANLSVVQGSNSQKSNVILKIYTAYKELPEEVYDNAYENKSVMVVDVIDEGSGIAQEVKDKIFDAFFTTKNQGMGMGLNICRSIIENHQGSLNVENNLHKGCTFTIILPLLSNIDIE